jgi:hypothetical protein
MTASPAETRRQWLCCVAIVVACLALLSLAGASPALAGAWWRTSSRAAPTFLTPGGSGTIIVSATNVGDVGIDASKTPVTIRDSLPPNLEATAIKGAPAFEKSEAQNMACDLKALTCITKGEVLPPFQTLDVTIEVTVKGAASSGEENAMSVQGGEDVGGVVPAATLSAPVTVKDEPTPFGVERNGYSLTPEAEGGTTDTQASSHPFQLTTALNLNQTVEPVSELGLVPSAPALPRRLGFNLPPGMIGDPRAVKPCSDVDFLVLGVKDVNACKPESAIGVAVVTLDEPSNYHYVTRAVPLWNLEPERGEPARFGFEAYDVPIVLDTTVRTDGDYGVTVSVNNATQAAQLLGSEVTIWGTPGDPSHDQSRGWNCVDGGVWSVEQPCESQDPPHPHAFLTLPTSCTGPLTTTTEGESWPVKALASEAGSIFKLEGPATEDVLPGLEGCTQVPFSPSIELEPDVHSASTATGATVDVHLPQEPTLDPQSLGESALRSASVTLPNGLTLNPSAANGLQACTEQEIGYQGEPGVDPLSPGAPQPLRFSGEPVHCPDASKVGTVRVHTPLLEHELLGSVYVAAQSANPFGSLIALYVVAEDPYSGVRTKFAGEVRFDEATGQITSTFLNTPQVPFEDFQLEFFNGPRASLSTPAACGDYATTASFTPWSDSPPIDSTADFQIASGLGESACPSNPLAFAPAFDAGSANLQAGGFTPFSVQIAHPDDNQPLTGVALRLPTGIAALLAHVTPCQEPPQGQEWACGAQSLIGHAVESAGVGSEPVTLTGQVYLTSGYDGAPFGLLVQTHAAAGPFDLGMVNVRSAIRVDPRTAQVTIQSEPGPRGEAIPTLLKGIPVDLKDLEVIVDRPEFEFNPTSCEAKEIEGTLRGASGGAESVSIPFQVSGCQNLAFKPTFTASTNGNSSKANGASLKVVVTSPGLGAANIARVDLQLPKALPARLTTLQKACTEAAFAANPASCPEGSNIGTATIHTPVLKDPLSGPAYLVSHGGAAFPDVEFVLQGGGVTLVLDGKTQIKNRITYSKFESAPDAPFTTFETILPVGPHSALTANVPAKARYSLCGTQLAMPTEITAHNGSVIKQTTKIAVQGCAAVKGAKAKKLTSRQKLALALKRCRQKFKRSEHKRVTCVRQARKHYAPKMSARKPQEAATKAHKARTSS